jgi:hypothetical protein
MAEPSTEHAREFFVFHGFRVDDIPVADVPGKKRADLRATIGNEEYVVEAKHRDSHFRWRDLLREAHESGFATTTRSFQPWNTLSKVVQKAHTQLIATPASPNAFRVLWIVALHTDDHFVIECFERLLLGERLVFAYYADNVFSNGYTEPNAMPCFYFDDNDFERYPEIDAAMLCTADGGRLFVNNYSRNRKRLINSYLFKTMLERGGVTDAATMANTGLALLLDTDFRETRCEGSQQSYLLERFNVLVSVAAELQFTGIAVAPVEPK